jgi:hypothetical protein
MKTPPAALLHLSPCPEPSLPAPRRSVRRGLFALLCAGVLLSALNGGAAVLFHDDFQDPNVGSSPLTTKWSRWGSTVVRNETTHTFMGNPEKFLRISGVNVLCAAKATIPLGGIVTARFEFCEASGIQSPGQPLLFGFGRNDNLSTSDSALAFALKDGSVSPTSGSTGPTGSYALDKIYEATVIYNRSGNAVTYPFKDVWHNLPAGGADLWLRDGTGSANAVKVGTYTSGTASNATQFLFRVFSSNPGNTVDIDNVYLHDSLELPDWNNTWRSVLFPNTWQPPTNTSAYDFSSAAFLQDYSYAGYRLRATGFPSTSLTSTNLPIFDVTQAPYYADKTGQTDVTTKIQMAIDDAGNAGGGLVYLPSGTYRVSPQGSNIWALRIAKSKVVLRGASATSTFIYNASNSMKNKSVVRIDGPASAALLYSSTMTPITSTSLPFAYITEDLLAPTRVIPVSNPGLFSVGNWVTLRSVASAAWAMEHGEEAWLNQEDKLGGLAYRRQVTAVGSNSITIDVPTRYAMKTRDTAIVLRNSSGTTLGLTECGVEYLSIGMLERSGTSGWKESDYSDSTKNAWHADGSSAIMVVRARDCWVRNVNSYRPAANTTTTAHLLSNGIIVNDSCRITLVNCNFQRPLYGGANGNGYMYRLSNASETLVDRCHASVSRHGFVLSSMRSSGNVFLRCTDTTTGRQIGGGSTPQPTNGSGNDHHMHFSHSNLIDSCTVHDSYFSAAYRNSSGHNITASHSAFWNTVGTGTSGGAVVRSEQSRYGYIIGTSGNRTAIDVSSARHWLNPIDHVEGIGQGATLSPPSLYEEQLARRKMP